MHTMSQAKLCFMSYYCGPRLLLAGPWLLVYLGFRFSLASFCRRLGKGNDFSITCCTLQPGDTGDGRGQACRRKKARHE